MTILDAQILQAQAYVMYWHAQIVSGAYKQHKSQRDTADGKLREETDEEKLARAQDTMLRHINNMGNLIDYIK